MKRWIIAIATVAIIGATGQAQIRASEIDDQLKTIATSYTKYLYRGAPDDMTAHWRNQLKNGVSVQELQAGILASEDYYSLYGRNDEGFIVGLVTDVIGQPVSSIQVKNWSARYRTLGSRKAVALEILQRGAAGPIGAPDLFPVNQQQSVNQQEPGFQQLPVGQQQPIVQQPRVQQQYGPQQQYGVQQQPKIMQQFAPNEPNSAYDPHQHYQPIPQPQVVIPPAQQYQPIYPVPVETYYDPILFPDCPGPGIFLPFGRSHPVHGFHPGHGRGKGHHHGKGRSGIRIQFGFGF